VGLLPGVDALLAVAATRSVWFDDGVDLTPLPDEG
jgi:hypothetical protein